MEENFLEFVADIMDVERNEISMEMEYNTGSWDSIMMMTLIMELEAEYDISIPIENVGKYKTLRDLYELTVA